ncbi:MAG: hypothetical protein ACLTTO_15035 [Lachnospiraceae bacterium]
MDDYKDVQNVMPIFKMEALMESEIHQILSAHKNFMAFIQLYNETEYPGMHFTEKSGASVFSWHTHFCFFYQKTEKATPAVSLPDLPWIPA